jgi:aminopeptidase
MIYLLSEDPDGLNGMNQEKNSKAMQSRFKVIKPLRDEMENKFQWCIAGVPGVRWAAKVFPGIPEDEAVEKLWEAILGAARANGDPIANWEEHNRLIHSRCELLNSYNFAKLRYKSSNGTDFEVGLMEQGIFAGGAEKDLSGRVFNPNIPSEEIFTTPKHPRLQDFLAKVL